MKTTNTDIRRLLSLKQRKAAVSHLMYIVTEAKEIERYLGATCNHVWSVCCTPKNGITRNDAYRLEDAYRHLTGALTTVGFSEFTRDQWDDMTQNEKNNYRISKLEQFCAWLLEGEQ